MISSKDINKNFVIRYRKAGEKKTHLVGGGKYAELVGSEDLAQRHFERAFSSTAHKIEIKLRRGLIINFCSK